jgi:hypothetical protein
MRGNNRAAGKSILPDVRMAAAIVPPAMRSIVQQEGGNSQALFHEKTAKENIMGTNNTEDAAAKKRKELAERLKNNQPVVLKKSGELTTPNDPGAGENAQRVPRGKLAASFYWYEREPELLEAEKMAMQKQFSNFQMEKLDDGRLCWFGNLNPSGADGGVWTVQAIYQPDHPNNKNFGGSVRVYSIKPDLDELLQEAEELPHILRDEYGHRYMCTARMEDVDAGLDTVTSAAKSLAWACKWIWMVEGWLSGKFGREVFDHTF